MSQSPKSWKPSKLGLRVELNPKAFRKLIFRRGSRVRWEKAARCPCTVMGSLGGELQATSEPRTKCPNGCFGLGFLYHDPQEIQAVVLGASKTTEFQQLYGERGRGMVQVTVLPEHMPKAWDRFTVLDSVHAVTEIRERTGARERLRYPVASANLELGADYDETAKVVTPWNGVYVRRADAAGKLVPVALEVDQDYTVDELGQIEWLGVAGTFATGTFTVTATPGTKIPAFTRFRAGSLDFLTTADVTAAGSTASLPMRCEVSGEIGNAASGFEVVCVEAIEGLGEDGEGLGAEAVSAPGTSGGVDGTVPAIGERFSIDYWAAPTYIVNDTPHPHRDNWTTAKETGAIQWARYPIQVHCWLETFGPPHGYATEAPP